MDAAQSVLQRKIAKPRGGQAPLSEVAHAGEMTARILEERMRQGVHHAATCDYVRAEIATFASLADSCAPTTLIAMADRGARGLGALVPLDSGLLFKLTEAVTGAGGEGKAETPDRTPTAIDEALAEDFVSGLLSCFDKAVAPTGGATPPPQLRFARYARTPASILELNADTELLRIELSLGFGGKAAEPTALSFYLTLDALDGYAAAARRARDAQRETQSERVAPDSLWAITMLRAANTAEIRLVSVMRELKMSVEEIAALTTGSVIPLSPEDGMTVEMRLDSVGGPSAFICSGRLGAHRAHRAVRVEEPPDPAFTAALARYTL